MKIDLVILQFAIIFLPGLILAGLDSRYALNSSRPGVEYMHFRDFGNQIVYAGWIDQFSATDKLRELVLNDVEIYDFDGKKLFDTPRIYLARQSDNIHIEFPYRGRPNG